MTLAAIQVVIDLLLLSAGCALVAMLFTKAMIWLCVNRKL